MVKRRDVRKKVPEGRKQKKQKQRKKETNHVPELRISTQEIPEMIGDVSRRSILQKKKEEHEKQKGKLCNMYLGFLSQKKFTTT